MSAAGAAEPTSRAPVARNAPCPCGSGRKHKHCCGAASLAGGAHAQFLAALPLLKSGDLATAIPLLHQATLADPMHADAHHALGWALLHSGDLANATASLANAVAVNPTLAAAHADLATAYDHQGLHEQAIAAYRLAVTHAPRLYEAHLRLGQLYMMYSRNEEAAEALTRAAEIKPKTTMARLLHADAEMFRGDIAGAERWARRAVALDPASAPAHGTLAGLLYAQGRFEEAAAAFEAALRHDPASAKAWDGLARCRRFTAADADIVGRMQDAARRPELDDGGRAMILFALGKILEDAGDYEGAMQQYRAANDIRGRTSRLDRAALAAGVDATIARFTPESLARIRPASEDTTPLFIVGMYRSGTTLVEQIVSSHPEIAAGGELTIWYPAELDPDPATGGLPPARTAPAIARYLAALRRIGGDAARVTDKLPTNVFRLGAIHALLPNARLIHCLRDPIDTCLSIYTTNFGTPIPCAARFGDLAFFYRQYQRLARHWREVLPEAAIHEIRYEDLVADRAAHTHRLIEATRLAWNEACLYPERNPRPIRTASAWQARQSVTSGSVGRWRRFEPWIGELLELAA